MVDGAGLAAVSFGACVHLVRLVELGDLLGGDLDELGIRAPDGLDSNLADFAGDALGFVGVLLREVGFVEEEAGDFVAEDVGFHGVFCVGLLVLRYD